MKEISSPKRRKSKDNPYEINIIDNNTYIIIFKTNSKEEKVQVNKEIYEAFNQFELEDIKQLPEYERHIEHSEQSDINLYNRAIEQNSSVEEIVENNILQENIKKAMNTLTLIQKRRIYKYFFENKTLEIIAKEENCSIMSVKESIDAAIIKLQKILKK